MGAKLTIRLLVLIVSPKRQKRGLDVPTTEATTGPEWNPTRMCTTPMLSSSSRTVTLLAAATAWAGPRE